MEIFQIGVMPPFTELEYSLAGEALGYWVTKPQLEVGDLQPIYQGRPSLRISVYEPHTDYAAKEIRISCLSRYLSERMEASPHAILEALPPKGAMQLIARNAPP